MEQEAVQLSIMVTYDFKPETLSNLLTSAFEGGYSPWVHEANLKTSKPEKKPGLVWWGQEELFNFDLSFEVVYDDPEVDEEGDGTGRKIVRMDDLRDGLVYMAENHPRHFHDLITENDDAVTADVFLQCVLFKEVHYG